MQSCEYVTELPTYLHGVVILTMPTPSKFSDIDSYTRLGAEPGVQSVGGAYMSESAELRRTVRVNAAKVHWFMCKCTNNFERID